MKNLKLFFALFAMLALGVGNAWADVITLTTNSTTVGKGTPVEGKFDYKLTFSSTTDAGNAYVQNAKNSSIFNTVAIPGTITSIKLTDCATTSTKTDGSFKVYGGTSSGNGCTNEMANITGLSSTKTDKTIDFSGNYAYFKIVVGSARVLKISSIVITYTPTGGGETPDPTVTVTLDKTELSLQEGENATLTATVIGSTDPVTWTSDASNIASVDNAGKVTAIAAGTANITAAIADVKATCAVTVTAATTPDEPGTGGETTTVTYVLKDDPNHPENSVEWFSGTIDQYTGWTATKGTNDTPKYYNTGNGLRVYNGGKFTITSTKVMTSITLTFSGTGYTFSASNTTNPQTVTPNAKSYEWSVSKTCRLQKIEITYAADGGDDPDPVDPEVTFSNGEYTVGGAALDLSTLLTTNSTGAVTYSVKTDGGTGATINGTSFTATAEGTCTVQASIAPTATHNAATATATISVTAPATVEGTWTLVTNATNLKAGDEIVIASNTKGKVAAALTDDYLGEYGVSFSNDKNTITALPATALVFTLGGSTGSWTLTNDGKSLGATAAKKLAWDKGTTTWSISIAEGNATIQNATDTYGRFLHNVQSTRFTTYTSDANANMLLPQIYKKAGNTPDPIKLATPENLSVSGVTASSATLSWTEVENANGYIVNLGGNEHETNTNSLILNELTASTTYKWTVKAKGDGTTYTDSEESETAEFTTPAAATPTAGYTIIHHRQALDGNYIADSLVVKTTGTADVGSTITAEKKTYNGFVCKDEVQTITIQADAAQNVVTYKYVRQSYTLTWDLDGGTIIAEGTPAGTVKYGAPLTAPTVEKAGYRFDHWYPDVPATMQDGNRTYKAFYTQQHTVKWVSQGTVIRTDTYDTGAALEAAPTTGIVECDGKKHVGWTAQGGYAHSTAAPADLFTESSGTVTADATYYAVYAEGSGGGGTGWTAVTSTSDLEAGATYAISNAANGGTYLSTWDGGNNFDGSTTTICPLILGGSEDAWTFQISDGSTHNDKYLTATSAASNRLKAVDSVDDQSYFTISFDGNAAVITCTGKNTNNILRYNANNGSPIFACYSSGQSDVYLQKQTGGGGYTNYTTSCATITDITIEGDYTTKFKQYDEFVFGGRVYAIDDEDNKTDVTELATFTGYDMSQAGEQTVTVTYSGHQETYTITVTKLPVWNITWSVGGQTSTGIGPREVVQGKTIGECSSTGDLQTPSVDCEGKVFMGWTESNTVPTDGVGIAYIDKNTIPNSDKTYYAVFAKKEVGDGVALTQCNGSTTFEAGDNIVIVASGDGWSYLCYQATSGTTYIAYSDFTNDAATLIEDNKNYWTLETANGGFYLGDVTNGYMYIVPSSNNMSVSSTNKSVWTIEWNAETEAFNIKSDRWLSCRHDLETNQYKWRAGGANNTDGTLNLQVYKINGSTSYTNYSTSCGTYTVTFYGFNSGGYTTTCNGNPAVDKVEQGGTYVIPNCEPTFDPAKLGRTFAGTWNTQANGKGTEYKPGDEIVNVCNDITLYAQWALNTSENTTLPTDVEDLATTDIIVTGGTTLTLQTGTTTINSLTLKGGIQADGNYKMPIINIPDNATLKRKSDIIYLDLVVNAKNYYPFAVPFRAKNGSDKANWDYVGYIDPDLKDAAKYRTHFVIKTYDGAKRAENGENRDANWVIVNRDTYLEPGIGYMITAMTAGKDTATIRIPMSVPNEWLADGEQESITVKEQTTTRNQVAVTAYTGKASDSNNGGHQRHAGWNFVANPYLSNFTGGGIDATNGLDYIDGKLIIQGSYEYSEETVPYVTVPAYDFAYYSQYKLSEATLSPAYSFFVQVGESGTMTFGRQQAPASIAARNAEERPVKMDVDITLSDNHSSDQTGIIISDRYNDTYEIGRDLEKLFGSAYNLSVYTLMADNTPLAFQALAIRSNMQVIPVGYRAPEQGEYTFRLNEATSSIDLLNEQYEQLVLVDYQTGELTNLLISDYTFYSERTQADNRFAIYAVPRQNAPTDLPNAIGQDKEAQKIIHNGHLYILRDGNVYNGNGQIVK